ncbi:MAG: preprotein translocase subunit SecE [Candidatus Pacebacteria bacterium]|jgi:preprotein translocase subunit SecE|nr:preprotein translocase subunit SecE [Candidatus Paceibacterota bacterium]
MNTIISYIQEVRAEMAHVKWPTRTQALAYTLAVIVISVVVAYFLGALDYGFSLGLEYILTN